MAYTQSKAQSGSQTKFEIGSALVSPTYTQIYEVNDFSQSGKQNKTADVTNLQSLAEEFIATLQTPGKYDLTMNRVSGDPGQVAIKVSFEAKSLLPYRITLPLAPGQTTTGDVYAFTAIVEGLDDMSSTAPAKQVITKASLKVSSSITLTVGT